VEVPQIFHSRNCTPQQLQQLHGYLDYLLEVNKTMNLTGK
jgi:16S rRNA G527 N7-methylase RsmG